MDFLCGVVEGFYNRPWVMDQRLHLFSDFLPSFGLNSYLYAPKDDVKHRALWRSLYKPSELECLALLIKTCQDNNVTFFYGLSPGLDLTYSNKNDLQVMKNKLDQLIELGCQGFALLWDDIDTSLKHEEDRKFFSTLAHAHVEVTNSMHKYLRGKSTRLSFLTCPVEYCSSRADPDVETSKYLNTLGSGLHEDIRVFWTGSKVVSENIHLDEILALAKVLRRKPVIWDNLHANDYDRQQLFLGPFAGRALELIPHLAGVMTNPNCEFSLNVPALFTLGAWKRSFDENETCWDPVKAAQAAIPHFLREVHRHTSVSFTSADGGRHEVPEDGELEEDDVELLFHLFWLPHSCGPIAREMVDDFAYLKEHAFLIQQLGLETNVEFSEDEDSLISHWIQRAAAFNATCKRISKMADKWTFVENRQLFFELNGYLNNVQVMAQACNRFVRWVGVDRCSKPISGGPTLAGLPGGVAGQLHRLYPLQRKSQYPLKHLTSSLDHVTVCQLPVKKMGPLLEAASLRLNCDLKAFVKSDSKAAVIYVRGGNEEVRSIDAFIVGTRPVEATRPSLWQHLQKYQVVVSVASTPTLLFTDAIKDMIELFLDMYTAERKQVCALVKKTDGLMQAFLSANGWKANEEEEDKMYLLFTFDKL